MKRKLLIIGLAALLMAFAIGGTVWAAEVVQPGWLHEKGVDLGALAVALQVDEDEGVPADDAAITRGSRGLRNRFVRGTVTAVEDDTVLVEAADGAIVTLVISDSTRLWVPGEPPTTTVELVVGDPVLAVGKAAPTETGERALAARLVVVVSDEDLPKYVIRGHVVAVTTQTLVVQSGRGERAITVLPRTQIWSRQGKLDSLLAVHEGEQIIALGQPTELGMWIARLVLLSSP
jgi:RNase P/RNase MRP subunit p29